MTKTYKAAVIGAGSGGLTLAIGLAGFDHDIALIEAGPVGGDCTNVGCVPSKALLHAASAAIEDPFRYVRAKRDELNQREDHEMVEHDRIDLVRGIGRLTARTDPHVVEVTAQDGTVTEIRAEHVVVCSGARPVEFPIEGLAPDRLVTNESLFDLTEIPSKIVMIGGGPISLEMATAFRGLDSDVEIVELEDRIMGREDPIVSSTIRAALEARGVIVHTGTSIERFEGSTAHLGNGGAIAGVDKVLLAVGRRPRHDDLGLDAAGVETYEGGIVADSWGKTSADRIWAVGDVTGNTATTHGANSIGRRTIRAIALPLPMVGAARVQPDVVYSRPEIASVGVSMEELDSLPKAGRVRYEKQLSEIDRGFTDDRDHGIVIVDAERFTGKIIRAAIVGPGASEMIGMFSMMIDHDIGLRKLFGQVHPYPSYAQAIGLIADEFAGDTYRSLPREWLAMMRGRVTRLVRRFCWW